MTGNVYSSNNNNNPLPRILVIYFPQYHPDPINDKNWGANFTDWVSLRNSPLQNRLGFDIPRPTELGYYDLRDTEPRKQQGLLAKQYGIDGFIYHHYWFYDRSHPGPNLEQPLVNMLKDGHPNIPFLLNWCGTYIDCLRRSASTEGVFPLVQQERMGRCRFSVFVEHCL
jgi:hypothetical protein